VAKGKLNLYALAQAGVALSTSQLHREDNEVSQAQNAIISFEEGRGAIRKRGGLAVLNPSALNAGASILAVQGVPLPLPAAFQTSTAVSQYLYAANYTGGGDTWKRTADGTTWATVESPLAADDVGPRYAGEALPPSLPSSFLYPSLMDFGTGSYRRFNSFDGTSDDFVTEVRPPDGTAMAGGDRLMGGCFHNGELYIGYYQDGVTSPGGRVYRLDANTGQLSVIGGALQASGAYYSPWSLISFNGSLWASQAWGGGGVPTNVNMFRINPDTETSWTADATISGDTEIGVFSTVVFQGKLYCAVASQSGNGRVYQRSQSGVWGAVFSGLPPSSESIYIVLGVLGSKILLFSQGQIYSSSTGAAASWTSEVDVSVTYSTQEAPGKPVVFQGASYWAFPSFVLKRTSGGVWSQVTTLLGGSARVLAIRNVQG
jgi:hypothetical protein